MKDSILWLCERFPIAKSNYNALVILYWKHIDGIEEGKLYSLTPITSITRNFRKLVEEGKIVVPDEVVAFRKQRKMRFAELFKK